MQDSGAGPLIKASSCHEKIVSAVKTVLASATFRNAANAVGQRIREADGARTGARVLAGTTS